MSLRCGTRHWRAGKFLLAQHGPAPAAPTSQPCSIFHLSASELLALLLLLKCKRKQCWSKSQERRGASVSCRGGSGMGSSTHLVSTSTQSCPFSSTWNSTHPPKDILAACPAQEPALLGKFTSWGPQGFPEILAEPRLSRWLLTLSRLSFLCQQDTALLSHTSN